MSDNQLCKSLYQSSFTYSGISDKDRVVFGSTREDLHGTADLLITSYNRIKLTFEGLSRDINSQSFQLLEKLLTRPVISFCQSFRRLETINNVLSSDIIILHQFCNTRVVLHQSKQEMLGTD